MSNSGYVSPHHRSLHGPLMVLAIFSIFLGGWSLFWGDARAINIQADQACQSGGVVGQACKDTTNGYTTSGHCTHIMVCAADSWPKAPRRCQPGQAAGRDCPYGKNYVEGPSATPRPINIATSTIYDRPADTIGSVDIFGQAFGPDSEGVGYIPTGDQKVVGTTSIEGIQYLLTDDNEKLQVGEPLTPAPPPPPQTELHLGSIYSLGPSQPSQPQGNSGRIQRGYTGEASFSGPPSNGSSDASAQSGGIIGNILNSIASMFGGQRPADELVVASMANPVMIVPDISLYYQVQSLSSPQLLDVSWNSLINTRRDITSAQLPISYLVRDALAHTAHIGLDLLTADLTAAHADVTRALSSGGQAVRQMGQSFTSSMRGIFIR